MGYMPSTVETGSMEPNVPQGSLCFMDTDVSFADISEGDVIAYRDPSMVIVHRVRRKMDSELIMRGDANPVDDPAPVKPEQVLGRITFHVPLLGAALDYVHENQDSVVTVAVAAAVFMIGLRMITFREDHEKWKAYYERRRRRKASRQGPVL
jgi:signal peptidase I